MTFVLPMLGGSAIALTAGSVLLLKAQLRRDRLATRLALLHTPAPGNDAAARPHSLAIQTITAIGTALARSGVLSTTTVAQLQQTLVSAGLRGANGLGLFVGCKLLLLVLLPVAAFLSTRSLNLATIWRDVALAAAAVVGLLAPDYWVRSRRAAYLSALSDGMADALDMMVICSEAGLGLEPALAKVAAEIVHARPQVATELTLLTTELRVSTDRAEALRALGVRTGLDSLKRLGATLIQTLQYGTPLAQALRILSAELRGEMLVRFEGRAARLPVLLTLPMIVFILPTVFVVVGGPAMLSVIASLHHH